MPARDEKNTMAKRPPQTHSTQLLTPQKLRSLYAAMLQCRLVKERTRSLFQQGRLQENISSRPGHEASEVGALMSLEPGDYIAPRRRDVITGFGLGCGITTAAQLKDVFSRMLHRSNNASSRNRSVGRLPTILASESSMVARINMATGVAMACKEHKNAHVVLAFSGDDSMALASWHEAIDLAANQKLPIVHIVQSDAYTEAPDPRLLSTVMEAENNDRPQIPTLIVDGNDVVAIYRVVQEAVRRARERHGPSLIECQMERAIRSSLTPTQPATQFDGDPLSRMETYLRHKGLWSDHWKQRTVESFTKQLDAAQAFAEGTSAELQTV